MSNDIRFGVLDRITRLALEKLRIQYEPSITERAFLCDYIIYEKDRLRRSKRLL
jgi:hypothetical protein